MSARRARQPVRWLPQTFRVRLTLLFAALFLAAGAALLGISYVLAVSQPDNVPSVTTYQMKLAFHCKEGEKGKTGPILSDKCAQAIAAIGATRPPPTCGVRHSNGCWPTRWSPSAP